jgi:hypothetical protein
MCTFNTVLKTEIINMYIVNQQINTEMITCIYLKIHKGCITCIR